MKILYLHLFPLWGNGSGVFLREVSTRLVDRHQIAILAPDKRTLPGVKRYIVMPSQNGVFVGNPELPGAKPFAKMTGRELGEIYTTYLQATVRAVDDFKPDIIHVFHTAFLPSVARLVKSMFGTRYIITTHGSDLSYLEKDKRFVGLMKEASQQARFITANSDFTKNWYLQLFGESLQNKTSVVVGGVNLTHFKRDAQQIETINKKYNLHNKKVVLFTGRLTINKGAIHLVRAAKSIHGTILIVGDGPERKAIEEEIKLRNIKNVILTGYINSHQAIYHAFYERADVYVAPSTWEEPLGLTILEAMAARTPVVATEKGGIVSIIVDKVNGFFVPSRNGTAIAQKVNMLLEDDELRGKISEAAYKTVVEKFTWEKIAKRFEKMYEELEVKPKPPEILPIKSFFRWLFHLRKKS